MINTSRRYTACTVDYVELAPGETFRFVQEAASASFGFFGLGGGTTMLEGSVVGRTFTGEGEWCPNGLDLGWSNDEIGHAEMLLEAGPGGAKWMCISRNATGDREIQHVSVDGAATVPAGWGFVVATGNVDFENKTATQFQYAAPRSADFTVTGQADLLLVR